MQRLTLNKCFILGFVIFVLQYIILVKKSVVVAYFLMVSLGRHKQLCFGHFSDTITTVNGRCTGLISGKPNA